MSLYVRHSYAPKLARKSRVSMSGAAHNSVTRSHLTAEQRKNRDGFNNSYGYITDRTSPPNGEGWACRNYSGAGIKTSVSYDNVKGSTSDPLVNKDIILTKTVLKADGSRKTLKRNIKEECRKMHAPALTKEQRDAASKLYRDRRRKAWAK